MASSSTAKAPSNTTPPPRAQHSSAAAKPACSISHIWLTRQGREESAERQRGLNTTVTVTKLPLDASPSSQAHRCAGWGVLIRKAQVWAKKNTLPSKSVTKEQRLPPSVESNEVSPPAHSS